VNVVEECSRVVIEVSDVRKTMIGIALGVLAVTGIGGTALASEPSDAVVFLVDTSGSMEGDSLRQAQRALLRSLDGVEEDRPVGLRAFAGACDDPPATLVEPATGNRAELESAVDGLVAFGGTPTGPSLLASAQDLPGGSGTIVLISDGFAECDPQPCDVAASLIEQGLEIRVNTVGYEFEGAPPADLVCIAEVTGGRYFDAEDEESLVAALAEATDGGGGGGAPIPLLVALAAGAGIAAWAALRTSAPRNQRRLVDHRVRVSLNPGRGAVSASQPDAGGEPATHSVRLEVRPGRWESRIVEGADHG
jgi:hypothetical protein